MSIHGHIQVANSAVAIVEFYIIEASEVYTNGKSQDVRIWHDPKLPHLRCCSGVTVRLLLNERAKLVASTFEVGLLYRQLVGRGGSERSKRLRGVLMAKIHSKQA